MPCRSDYMEPNGRERRLQKTAQLYAYVLEKLDQPVPQKVQEASGNIYCTSDFVPKLCKLLSGLNEQVLDELMYDGRSKMARKLADWWDEHLEADRQRLKQERDEKAKKAKLKRIKAKLTEEELAFLKDHIRD